MVSFWQKKDEPNRPGSSGARDEGHGNVSASDHEEPTERSRLLPPHNDRGYLSPDDPAVGFIDPYQVC